MTLQSDLKLKCVDCLDYFKYELLHKGKVVETIESESEHKYGVITISGNTFYLDLFETYSALMKRADITDPQTYILTVN